MTRTEFIMPSRRAVTVAGKAGATHLGQHLSVALSEAGYVSDVVDAGSLNFGGRIERSIRGWIGAPKPSKMYSQMVVDDVQSRMAGALMSTGAVPLNEDSLRRLSASGVYLVHWSTDNPMAKTSSCPWLRRALPYYDEVWTPRHNTDELIRLGCKKVKRVPWAYNPNVHKPHGASDLEGSERRGVAFIGYGDRFRQQYFRPLLETGLELMLYGGGWPESRLYRPYYRGFADLATQRSAYRESVVAPCIVRHSNNDDHVMRTFEGAAMGATMIYEGTSTHRSLFGPYLPKQAFFNGPEEMARACLQYARSPSLRDETRRGLMLFLAEQKHTYRDRILEFLRIPGWS